MDSNSMSLPMPTGNRNSLVKHQLYAGFSVMILVNTRDNIVRYCSHFMT